MIFDQFFKCNDCYGSSSYCVCSTRYNIQYLRWKHGSNMFIYNMKKDIKLEGISDVPDFVKFEDYNLDGSETEKYAADGSFGYNENKKGVVVTGIDFENDEHVRLLEKHGLMKIRNGMLVRKVEYRGGEEVYRHLV